MHSPVPTCPQERGWNAMEGLGGASCEGEGNELAIFPPGLRSLGGLGSGLQESPTLSLEKRRLALSGLRDSLGGRSRRQMLLT